MAKTFDNVAFITLTNTGYLDYTLNCLKSLELSGMTKPLHCYCIGEEGYNILKDKGYTTTLVEDKYLNDFAWFMNDKWAEMMANKLYIIYENLLKYEFVCYTDGDITFHNPDFLDYLLRNIGDNDIVMQIDTMDNNDYGSLCAGFMFIRSTEQMREIFNPKNVKHSMTTHISPHKWEDQSYINSFKYCMKIIGLPLELFPNGQYYYMHHMNINPYIIHFNWIVGHAKKEKMIKHNKWFL